MDLEKEKCIYAHPNGAVGPRSQVVSVASYLLKNFCFDQSSRGWGESWCLFTLFYHRYLEHCSVQDKQVVSNISIRSLLLHGFPRCGFALASLLGCGMQGMGIVPCV
jgi:hypothetical protein